MSKIVEIKRLVESGKINGNGIKFDTETLNKALTKFKENDASIRKDNYTVDEINEMIVNNTMTSGKFDIIGQLLDFTDTHLKIKLFEGISDEEIEKYSANIHAISTNIEEVEKDTENYHRVAYIDEVNRIIIKKY